MKLHADECCDAPLVNALRADGHDVTYVADAESGISDRPVLEKAFLEERILLTEDKDFGELVVRLHLPARGVILLRMNPADVEAKLDQLRKVFAQESHRLLGHFIVVEHDRWRVRPIPTW